jgi:anthranilate synthase component 2
MRHAPTTPPRVLVIDNYDSFTYNLVHDLGMTGAAVDVVRNDAASAADVLGAAYDGIVVSPGPGGPADAGICTAVIADAPPELPILGVCLGHQVIGAAFGADIVRSAEIVHGKVSEITHAGRGVFAGLPNPLPAGRYHSLVVHRATLPPDLTVTAWSPLGEVMGLAHRTRPIEGVQFHPESLLTADGFALVTSWITYVSRSTL